MLKTFAKQFASSFLVLWTSLSFSFADESPTPPPSASAVATVAEQTFVEVVTDPVQVQLTGPDAQFTLLVAGRTSENRWIDLTHLAKYKIEDRQIATVDPHGVLSSHQDGRTRIHVEVAGRTLAVPVIATNINASRNLSFSGDIEPMLSRFACNSSGCHGKAEGQNGFKLSVFGFDPKSDYQAIVMEGRGRRVFLADPERSLLLGKASGKIPHGGGVRIRPNSQEYELLSNWLTAGAPFGPEGKDIPEITKLEVTPHERVASAHQTQQLRVVATYNTGRRADVTHLARFQANNGLAAVNETGLVTYGEVPGQAAIMATFAGAIDTFQVLLPQPNPLPNTTSVAAVNFIDHHIQDRLKQLNIAPSEPGSDAEFLRRTHLDIIGRLPSAKEARDFLTDESPGKRIRLVNELLARPEYADYWALIWSDLLRVERVKLGHQNAYAYYRWIRDSFAKNKPLDAWTRELLTAEGPLSESPQGFFYRVSKNSGEMAANVSQVFLGVRIACAECHHHPWDKWGQDDYYGMQAFFQQVHFKKGLHAEEMILTDGNPQVKQPRTGEVMHPRLLGTAKPVESADWMESDRRQRLAIELTSAENPSFANNMANRLFAHFMGQGLVEPVDDVRDTNPPHSPELHAALGQYLIDHNYDAHALIRLITSSAAYQRSSKPNASNEHDEQNFSRALFRRLPAEVLHDAISDTTGVQEKFEGMPIRMRAVQLWDSKSSDPFLKLFGRPARTTACQCERVVQPSMAQVLHLMNSPRVAEKISHPNGQVAILVAKNPTNAHLVDELYLTFFSRFPSADERQKAIQYLDQAEAEQRATAAEDLAWSMLNSLEFVFNH